MAERLHRHMRRDPMSGAPLGLDLGEAALLAQALGYQQVSWVELFPYAEAGMVEGIRKLRAEQEEERKALAEGDTE